MPRHFLIASKRRITARNARTQFAAGASRRLRYENLEDRRLLSIDASVDWSAYLGTGRYEWGEGIAADASGNVLVAGETQFPSGDQNAFVKKISSNGQSLLWERILGGASQDRAQDVVVDASGNVFVVGRTSSSGWSSGNFGGGEDAFVAKLDPNGNLLWSQYYGGSGVDGGLGIALSKSGELAITGETYSPPWSPLCYGQFNGDDAFVARINPDNGQLMWWRYLGGANQEYGFAVAVDSSSHVFVTGQTRSSTWPGWTFNGFDKTYNGGATDGFIVQLNMENGAPIWSSFIGGASDDWSYGMALDGAGNPVVTGPTLSANWPDRWASKFALGFDSTYGADWDGFALKFSSDGTEVQWATYLGANGWSGEVGQEVAVGSNGDVFVTGSITTADWVASVPGAMDTTYGGVTDGFVAKITPTADNTGRVQLAWATCLGGSGWDAGYDIALDAEGQVLVTGRTESANWSADPLWHFERGFDSTYNGGSDAFVTKINAGGPPQPGSISGTKWNDIDGDGVRDPGEQGLPGWDIQLQSLQPTGKLLRTLNNPHPTNNYDGYGDRFGGRVAISGQNVVTTAYLDLIDGTIAGSAIVFDGSGNATTIHNPTPGYDDRFGWGLAASDDYIAIGAYLNYIPIDPNLNNTDWTQAGSVYVYNARNLALPPTVIDNPTPAFQDGFGYHAALLGGDAVIAAMGDDTYGSDAGIVYKFSGTDGSELLKLYSPNTRPNDWFGHALAVSANRIYVAAPGDDSAAADAGAVYWFDGTTGARLGVIPNPRGAAAAGEKFGYQGMAANGNLLAVGCPYADVSGAADAGVVDLFDMDTGSHLTIPNPEPGVGDWFGMSVTFVDGMLLVGAQNDDVGATDAGSAYVFDPSTGALLLTLHNPAPTNGIASGGIGFGGALAAMGNDYVISANGVVYVFEGLPNPITGTTNSDGDYSFPGVAPGNYVLSEVIQPGWRQTKPDGDGKYRISLSSGENLTGLDFGNQHLNTPPVITSISATTPVSEGQATTLTVVFTDPDAGQRHEATIDWGDGQVEPVPIEPDVYAFERSHLYSDNRPSDAPYPITVTVADDLSRSDPGYVFVEVDNVAPTATFSNDGPVAEGSPANVAFADQFDPSPVDTERGFHYSIVLDPAQLAETYDDATDGPSKAFTFADNGAYTVYGRIFDKDDGYQDHETVVTVDNVDPVLTSIESSASAGGGVAEGEPIVVSGTFTDVGTLDVHTARVDWGDGSSSDAQIVESNGSDGLQASHAYAGGGVYTIAVTLKDDDTGTDAKTTLAVVSGSGVRDGTLYVVGTDNDDHVTINQRGNGLLKVHADFFPEANFRTYTAAGIRAIEVLLYGGSDQATVAGNIITPVLLDGGSGNDRLNGGGGPNILLGGIGDDKLIGGAAADILIGGLGSDRLVGNGGDDILVAGSATVDPDPTVPGQRFDQALLSLVTEWNRSKSKGTIRSRLHAMDDGVEDVLTGSAGQDWFFARSQGLARDRILGRGADETVDELG